MSKGQTRRYKLSLVDGGQLSVEGRLWSPWTFPVLKNGREVARITKRWSGFLREACTRSDNFSLTIQDGRLSEDERLLLLTTLVAIDLDFFNFKD